MTAKRNEFFQLSDAKGNGFWPPKRMQLSIEELLDGDHLGTVVYSQYGLGVKSFMEGVCSHLRDRKVCYLNIMAAPDGLVPINYNECPGSRISTTEKKGVIMADLAREMYAHNGKGSAHAEQRRLLREAIIDIDGIFWLLTSNLPAFNDEVAVDWAGELRGLLETQRDKFRLLIMGNSETFFTGSEVASALGGLCNQYRMGWLNPDGVKQVLSDKVAGDGNFPRLTINEDDWPRIHRWTGGAPILVHDLVQRIADFQKNGSEVSTEVVMRAIRAQRAAPPRQTNIWCGNLREVVETNVSLAQQLRTYVMGQYIDLAGGGAVPGIDLPLFIRGWVRESDDKWGITSNMHASLARRVLDELDLPDDVGEPLL